MNFRDFKIGWRLLLKEPAYSAVVIGGLAVGVTASFLLLGLVRHSFQYDANVPDNDRIYVLKEHDKGSASDLAGVRGNVPMLARDAVLASGLPLQAAFFGHQSLDMRAGDRSGGTVQRIELTTVDPAFIDMFGVKAVAGDVNVAVTRPDALALTEETAIRLFGSTNVVGKVVQIGQLQGEGEKKSLMSTSLTVSAVLANPPTATTTPYAALTGVNTATWNVGFRDNVTTNWGQAFGRVYVKLGAGVTPQAVTQAVNAAFQQSPYYAAWFSPGKTIKGLDSREYEIGKLRDDYLDADLTGEESHASGTTLMGLSAVALLILLLATTNYVNLATVRTLRRQREIAVRKVMGASATQVVRQFLSESVLVCLLATLLGLVFAWLLLPAFSTLVQRQFDDLFSPTSVLICAALGVLLGLLAGAYPTWSAYTILPTTALSARANSETASGLWLRRTLTVLQFATALGLTGLTLAVAWQTRFASNLNPGFDPLPLVVIHAPEGVDSANGSAFRDTLARIPGVSAVALSDSAITEDINGNTYQREGGNPVHLSWRPVSPEYFDVHRIGPIHGRLFSPKMESAYYTTTPGNRYKAEVVVINEAAAAQLGFASSEAAVGQMVSYVKSWNVPPWRIVGIVPELHHRSARSKPQATIYHVSNQGDVFTVRTDDRQALRKGVESVWPRFFPNHVLRLDPAQDAFVQRYADDLRYAKLLAVASAIAIAIAAFGIYVLAAYTVQRRVKEIVLRKLYGARRRDIGMLVTREFAVLIGVGALLGLPLAFVAIERHLSAFVERAPIGVWTLFGSLVVAVLVALASTIRHTVGAMRIAPAMALRD